MTYTVELHEGHADHPERDAKAYPTPCDVAYVVTDAEGWRQEICTCYQDGSAKMARKIAAALNAFDEAAGGPPLNQINCEPKG